jgi:hypothetical protein
MQPESPAAWLNVLAYFKRVNESVPFTDEELVLLDEYVHNQQTTTSTMEPR